MGKGGMPAVLLPAVRRKAPAHVGPPELLLQPCLILSGLWSLSPMYIGCLLAIPAPSSARKSLDIGTGRPHNGFELWAFQSQVGNLLLQGIKND